MPTEAGYADYKGWKLRVHSNWDKHGRAVFFVVGPGDDPRCISDLRTSYDMAVIAGRKILLHEAAR